MPENKGGYGQGGRGGAVQNRFPNPASPTQRPADVNKGASNEGPSQPVPPKQD